MRHLLIGSLLAASFSLGCGGDDAATATAAATAGGTSSGQGGGGTTGSTSGVTTGGGGAPAACADGPGEVLAMSQLFLGDRDFGGTVSGEAWKGFGFNLDGKASTPQSTDLCQPSTGGTPDDAYPDGNGGIDNSFGRNVLPIFLDNSPTAPEDANASIAAGEYTFLLRMDGLGTGADSAPFLTQLYGGAALAAPPLFDGSDCWPVTHASVADPTNVNSATTSFPSSSVTAQLWTSGSEATVILSVPSGGTFLDLVIRHARVSVVLDADHGGATGGQIGGVVDTEEFLVAVRKLVTNSQPVLCSDAIWDAIANQIRRASDMMKDGTQDPTQVCDGISIGLGFTMERVLLGEVADPPTPGPDPCMP